MDYLVVWELNLELMVLRNDFMVFMMLGIVSCWTSFRFLFGKLNSRGVGWWGSNPRHWTPQRVPTLLGYHSESNNIHPPPPPLLFLTPFLGYLELKFCFWSVPMLVLVTAHVTWDGIIDGLVGYGINMVVITIGNLLIWPRVSIGILYSF